MSKNSSHKGLGAVRKFSRRQTLVDQKKASWIPMQYDSIDAEWEKSGLP